MEKAQQKLDFFDGLRPYRAAIRSFFMESTRINCCLSHWRGSASCLPCVKGGAPVRTLGRRDWAVGSSVSWKPMRIRTMTLYLCSSDCTIVSVPTAQSPLPPFTQGGHALRNRNPVPFNPPINYNLSNCGIKPLRT